MEELLVLKVLLNKESYVKYKKYIDKINFENEPKAIYEIIGMYFAEYPEIQDISVDELKTYFYIKYPVLRTRESYGILFENLDTLEITNQDLFSTTMKNLIEKFYASDIIDHLTKVLSGAEYGVLKNIEPKLKEFTSFCETKEDASPFVEDGLDSLLASEVLNAGLKWRLDCLNHDVGDLRGGSLGHVYARPDTGKTSFFASEISHLAKQLQDGEIIAWFNNEERGSKVKLRVYSSLLNKTKEEIAEDPDAAEKVFKEKLGDRIKIYDSAIITISDIEVILKQYNVRVLVIDQGDKIKFRGDKDMAQHERLKRLYGIFRELAKEYNCDIITAGQASAAGEGQRWLTLDMMDNSKTGKPGELDYAIGIGFSNEEGKEAMRFIHLAKNKMKNGVHGRHFVRFDALRARYSDITMDQPINTRGVK
jgi:replicative DNA helicase